MQESNHFHWIIWAYERQDDAGNCLNNTPIDVIADDFEQAFEKARRLVPMSAKGTNQVGYRLSQVIEHLPGACGGHH